MNDTKNPYAPRRDVAHGAVNTVVVQGKVGHDVWCVAVIEKPHFIAPEDVAVEP